MFKENNQIGLYMVCTLLNDFDNETYGTYKSQSLKNKNVATLRFRFIASTLKLNKSQILFMNTLK